MPTLRPLVTHAFISHFMIGSLPASFGFKRFVIETEKTPTVKQVNEYRLVSKLGKGISSEVFLARDMKGGGEYAVKCVKLGKRNSDTALRREIEIMEKLANPNVIALHEVLVSPSTRTFFLVMELAKYGSLSTLLSDGLTLTEGQLRRIFKGVVNGLIFIHSRGFAHRDVKPSNIMIVADGSAKLGDFGISTSFESAEGFGGTPAYQAPETLEEDDDFDPPKADVWALGVSIYEAFHGRFPWQGMNLYEIQNAMRTEPLEIDESASPELTDLLERMLTIKSGERISMEEVAKHPFFMGEEEEVLAMKEVVGKRKDVKDVKYISAVGYDPKCTLFGRPSFSLPHRFNRC